MVGLAVAALAAGCISSPTEPQSQVAEPTSVVITPEQLTTMGGMPDRFTAEVLDAAGATISGTSVDWSTSDPTVAVVDRDGLVWSFAEGTTMASANFQGRGNSSPNGNAYGHSKKDAAVTVTQVAPDRPGQVSDLSVASTTTGSATLSFTEVGDGTGSPANYVVRFQVGAMDWGTATDVSSGTCSAPRDGTSTSAKVTCTVTNLSADTNYKFQLVAFRGSYPTDMVYGDLSNVASGSTPAPPDPTTQPQPGGSAGHPNEPAGLTAIAALNFTDSISAQVGECKELGSDWKHGNTEYIGDSSAPTGDGRVFRGKFPAGMKDGGSPWRFDCWDSTVSDGGASNDYSEVYISYWLKIEGSSFENQVQGTKTIYWAHGSTIRNNHSFGRLDGTFSDQAVMTQMQRTAYIYQMESDGSDAGGGAHHETANVNKGVVQPGRWQQFEVWMKINDIGPTRDNGEFKMWVDGQLTHHLTGLRWRSDQNPKAFYHLQFTPVYGGNSGNVRTRDDYWRIDDLFISARN